MSSPLDYVRSHRRGSAMFVTVIFAALATGIIVTSVQGFGERNREIQNMNYDVIAISALEAVLAKHELVIIDKASSGDPDSFLWWSEEGDTQNYGEDYFGGCRVRWKVEPAAIAELTDLGTKYIANPQPPSDTTDPSTLYAADGLQPNEFTYIYRVSGEARFLPDGEDWDDEYRLGRAQGVRYVGVSKQPVFRYVIFYAQEGPKGDLEFNHGKELKVNGDVHSNGAIFLGSDTAVDDFLSINGGSASASSRSKTTFGSLTERVRVVGVLGIYRLSKHILYGAANPDFPMSNKPSLGSWYDTNPGGSYTNEGGAEPAFVPPLGGADINVATHGGRIINPARVTSSIMVTAPDQNRTINGNPINGVISGDLKWNDSRNSTWVSQAMQPAPEGFDGYARTMVNGGRTLRLPGVLGNRAFEAQRVRYDDLDGDPTTDEHAYALPLFVDATGLETDVHPTVPSAPIIESPGQYLRYAFGSGDLYFARKGGVANPEDYNGWVATRDLGNGDDVPAGVDVLASVGLIIRERPKPDDSYFSVSSPTAAGGHYYLPYAYGKHTRSQVWPYWVVDVTGMRGDDRGIDDAGTNDSQNTDDYRHFNLGLASYSYSDGAILDATAAMDRGPDDQDADHHNNRDGWYDSNSTYRRYPHFYRNNFRMFHMRQPIIDESRRGTGLIGTYYNDTSVSGTPLAQQLDAEVNTNFSTKPSGLGNDDFSVRWTGFVTPTESGGYTFIGRSDDGMRVWVNGELVVDAWRNQGASDRTTNDIVLEKDEDYPIVVEFFEDSGGNEAVLKWKTPSNSTAVVVPTSVLSPAESSGFVGADVAAVQMRIDSVAGPDQQKVGIVMRPLEADVFSTAAGNPLLNNGLKAYWPFDEGTGTAAADLSGNNNNGSTGGATFDSVNGQTLGSVLINGANQGVNIPASGTINNIEAAKRTISLWFRRASTDVNTRHQMLFEEGGGSRGINAYIYNGNLYLRGWNENEGSWFIESSETIGVDTGVIAAPADTNWHHLVLVLDAPSGLTYPQADVLRGYLDGVLFAELDGSQLWAHGDPTGIGNVNGSTVVHTNPTGSFNNRSTGWFDGWIDEFRIYDTPWSEELIEGVAGVGPMPGGTGNPNGHSLPHLADGRDPYLALWYSPERGFFTEYRGARASTTQYSQNSWFVGSSSGVPTVEAASGESGVDPSTVTRTITVDPDLVSEVDDLAAQYSNLANRNERNEWYDGGSWRTSARWWNTSTPSTQSSASYVEDETNKKLYWYQGSIERNQRIRVRRWINITLSETWQFTLSTPDAPTQQFDYDLDRNEYFKLFDGTTGANSFAEYRLRTGSNDDPRWTIPNPGNYLLATWTNKETETVFSYGTTETVTYPTSASDTVVWWDSSSSNGDYRPWVQVGSNKIRFSSQAEFQAAMTARSGLSGYTIYNTSTELGDPTATAPTPPDWPLQTDFSVTEVSDSWANKVATYNTTNGTSHNPETPQTFQVTRGRTIDADINPYVSAFGEWYDTPVEQFLPWPDWADPTPVATGGFRPDLWWGLTAPTASDTATVPNHTSVTSGTASSLAPLSPVNGNARPVDARWLDDQPLIWDSTNLPENVWLRLERVGTTNNFRCLYYTGAEVDPDASLFTPIRKRDGGGLLTVTVERDLSSWGDEWMIGPAIQSGDDNAATTARFTDMKIEFLAGTGPSYADKDDTDVLDVNDWEESDDEGATFTPRYLASQYQVFWGPTEITEAFFTYLDDNGERMVNEDWIYNPREFFSQSRWWANGDEKDSVVLPSDIGAISNRELLSKQTLLTVNMRALQHFLINTDLNVARTSTMEGGYDSPATPLTAPPVLKDMFNGLVYVARTNRYPWNPSLDGPNPWNVELPNATTGSGIVRADLLATAPAARRTLWEGYHDDASDDLIAANVISLETASTALADSLQPYALALAPAFKPSQFHHGVRMANAEAMFWGHNLSASVIPGSDPVLGATPVFGAGKTSFVTPNQLMLHGDINTWDYVCTDGELHVTPMAVFGDLVTLLSSNWDDALMQEPGITADGSGVTGGGSLGRPAANNWPDAASTDYNTSIVTHNIPTTRTSVRDGEAASIISTLLFLEDWGPLSNEREMKFTGSLVVMDSRRYSRAYQLEGDKTYGMSPFGVMGWHHGKGFHEDGLLATPSDAANKWNGNSPSVYFRPERIFTFNEDLLTEDGTPPFTPFGVSSAGVGNWTRAMP